MFETRAQFRRICLLFGLLLALSAIASDPVEAQIQTKGVADLDGRAVNPFQHAAGKIVVLVFVRTDCPISNRYAPSIHKMSAQFGKSAEFFLVYPIGSESAGQIRTTMILAMAIVESSAIYALMIAGALVYLAWAVFV